MKRVLSGLCAAALLLSLAACGGSGKAAEFDPAKDAEALLAAPGLFSESLTQVEA